MDNNAYEHLIGLVVEFFRNKGIEASEAWQTLGKCRKDVLEKLLETKTGFFVLKRDGRIESFSSEKLYTSIANASDEISEPLNKSDIDNIVRAVVSSFGRTHYKVIESETIRQIVLDSLENMGFRKVQENFKKYAK